MKKVIAFGEALIDMLSTSFSQDAGDEHEAFIKFPGGAPANVAAAVGKLGGRSYFAGMVGKDMFGDFLVETLAASGVDTSCMLQTREAKTALAFVSLDATGERSFEFYRSPSADLLFREEHFDDAWFTEPGIFHFCSNTLTESAIRETTLAGIAKARETGFLISFDVNLRHNLWSHDEDAFAAVWQCIPQVDLLKLCVEELEYLCAGQDEDAVLNKMLEMGPSVILVTDGGKGVRYVSTYGQGSVVPPKVTMVDSTAAGDAFVGGLLYALAEQSVGPAELKSMAQEPTSLLQALRIACACGAYTVTQKGAINSLPMLKDIQQLLSE